MRTRLFRISTALGACATAYATIKKVTKSYPANHRCEAGKWLISTRSSTDVRTATVLNVESEFHDVAVFYQILFSFNPQFSGLSAFRK